MANNSIVLVLGVISSITLIISALSVHRARLLTFSAVTTALVIAQLVISRDPLSTILICAIGVVQMSILLLAEKRFPRLNHWSVLSVFLATYAATFAFSADFGTMNWYEWLPLLGSFAGTIGVFITKMGITKSLATSSAVIWAGYYLFAGMNTQLIGQSFTIAANAVALAMIIKASRNGIPVDAIRDIDDRLAEALTGSIRVVTESIQTVTQSNRIINPTGTVRTVDGS
jgi:hypothetical protein